MNEKPLIAIRNLHYHWPKQPEPTIAIDEWSLDRGQRVFLYGPSGSGKSTLLNLIAGILLPQSGSLELDGTELTQLKAHQRDRFRAQNMGIIFQQFNLVPYLTVSDNIGLSAHFSTQDNSGANSQQGQQELIERLGLEPNLLQRNTSQLSVGQQQRVAVARALFHQPKLLIADEPTSALDSDARDQFIELLLTESARHQSTVLFVSHDRGLAQHFDTQVNLNELNGVSA